MLSLSAIGLERMLTMKSKTHWLVSLVCLAATSPATANKDDDSVAAPGVLVIIDAPPLSFVEEEPVSTAQSDVGAQSILSAHRESGATPRKDTSADDEIMAVPRPFLRRLPLVVDVTQQKNPPRRRPESSGQPWIPQEDFQVNPIPRSQVERRPIPPPGRVMSPESHEAPAQVNNLARPQRSTTPIPPRVESHAVRPPQDSPTRMQPLGHRAANHVNYGFALAARGAVFSAEAEFIQALALIAESRDDATATRHHTRALEAGLVAVDEANDFVPDDAQLRPELNVSMIIAGHRTPVIRGLPREALEACTAIRVQQEYYSFAQDSLLQAVGHHSVASQAFYALARLQNALCKGPGGKRRASGPRSLLLHRLALITDGKNYKAANEIGVLLTRYGMLAEARRVLIHSVSLSERPQTLYNLSVVLERLGDRQAADELRSRSKDLNHGASLPASEIARNVYWTKPEEFDEGTVYLASQAGALNRRALNPSRAIPRIHSAVTKRRGAEKDGFNWFPWKRR